MRGDAEPGRYRPKQAAEAWQLMHDLLNRAWSGGYPADRVRWAFERDIADDDDPRRHVRQA